MDDDTQEHPNPERWWRERRLQARIGITGSAVTVVAYSVAVLSTFVPPDLGEVVRPVIIAAFWGFLSLPLAYHGGCTLVDRASAMRSGR